MTNLEVICKVEQVKSGCMEKNECSVCPYNKNSINYDIELVNFYKEAKLIGELMTKVSAMGPDAEGVRIRW